MELAHSLLADVVCRILSVTDADRIILFGSAASGKMTRDSDLDILVLRSCPTNTRADSVAILKALRGVGFPVDVLVMDTDAFEESKDVVGGIAYPVHKYGRVLYEAS